MTKRIESLLDAASSWVTEISPEQAIEQHISGALLIDLREQAERISGSPPGSLPISRSHLEAEVDRHSPRQDQPIILLCSSGVRSRLAAHNLHTMGFQNLYSVRGGIAAWRRAALPLEPPTRNQKSQENLSQAEAEQYLRQIQLPEIGLEGQLKLKQSRVAIIGVGGLGCPAATYLAAAGIGKIRMIDPDVVERSNLHRQLLYSESGIGVPKVYSASQRLREINSEVEIECLLESFSRDNGDRLLADCDVVIDGSDNLFTRAQVNEVAHERGIPLISASVYRFEGQITAFSHSKESLLPCYECLFPKANFNTEPPACTAGGVMGVLPGVFGCLQATEALKILTGIGTPLYGRLLTFNALDMQFHEFQVKPDPLCRVCGQGTSLPSGRQHGHDCRDSNGIPN